MLSLTMKKADITAKLARRDPNYCLVVNFENSVPPQFWHLDLEKNPTFTLSLRGSGDDWALGMTEHKSEFVAVARFDNRDDAEDAYAAVQNALMSRAAYHGRRFWKWLVIVLAVLVLLFVANSALNGGATGTQEVSAVKPADAAKPPASQFGVPLSADDLLKGQ